MINTTRPRSSTVLSNHWNLDRLQKHQGLEEKECKKSVE